LQPRVSIITPIYNSAAFLDEAIESVFAQDYADWELMLVDDGSTDTSMAIAQNWCRQDERIRLLLHPGNRNRGSSASRNLAIAESSGELLALLDADDVWLAGKLRFQIDTLDAHPEVALTFGAAERWFSWNPASSETDFIVPAAVPGYGSDVLVPPPHLLQAFLLDESLTPCTCATVLRRDAIDPARPFEVSFPGLYDDQVFLAKICLRYPVFATSRCVARYRKHANSCCAVAARDGADAGERARFLEWLAGLESTCVRLS
jgi:glycosyltransferase involved in cell wall biosynthesis